MNKGEELSYDKLLKTAASYSRIKLFSKGVRQSICYSGIKKVIAGMSNQSFAGASFPGLQLECQKSIFQNLIILLNSFYRY